MLKVVGMRTDNSNKNQENLPIRPENGVLGIELLKQDKTIEVENEVAFWFMEELDRYTDFSYCYHLNKFNKGWTALYKYEV